VSLTSLLALPSAARVGQILLNLEDNEEGDDEEEGEDDLSALEEAMAKLNV